MTCMEHFSRFVLAFNDGGGIPGDEMVALSDCR
jgi:hypothetical protein